MSKQSDLHAMLTIVSNIWPDATVSYQDRNDSDQLPLFLPAVRTPIEAFVADLVSTEALCELGDFVIYEKFSYMWAIDTQGYDDLTPYRAYHVVLNEGYLAEAFKFFVTKVDTVLPGSTRPYCYSIDDKCIVVDASFGRIKKIWANESMVDITYRLIESTMTVYFLSEAEATLKVLAEVL